jgi:ribokinase
MLGGVGQDEFGPRLIAGMAQDGIDVSGIRQVENQTTGVAVILVESSNGENRIMLSPGANHTLLASHFLTPPSLGTPLPDLLIMQLEIPLATVLQILKTAQAANVPVLLNPAPAVPLSDEVYTAITHLIVNETEAALLSNRSLADVSVEGFDWSSISDDFIAKGAQNVVITLGSKGAFWASSGSGAKSNGYVPAAKVEKVVDTTAAGDTFVGAYAVQVVQEGEAGLAAIGGLGEVVRRACIASGKTVEKEGAQNAIPWADEVEW